MKNSSRYGALRYRGYTGCSWVTCHVKWRTPAAFFCFPINLRMRIQFLAVDFFLTFAAIEWNRIFNENSASRVFYGRRCMIEIKICL